MDQFMGGDSIKCRAAPQSNYAQGTQMSSSVADA